MSASNGMGRLHQPTQISRGTKGATSIKNGGVPERRRREVRRGHERPALLVLDRRDVVRGEDRGDDDPDGVEREVPPGAHAPAEAERLLGQRVHVRGAVLLLVLEPGGVEAQRVRVALRLMQDAPARRTQGRVSERCGGGGEGRAAHQTFGITVVPRGIRKPAYSSSAVTQCASPNGVTGFQRSASQTMHDTNGSASRSANVGSRSPSTPSSSACARACAAGSRAIARMNAWMVDAVCRAGQRSRGRRERGFVAYRVCAGWGARISAGGGREAGALTGVCGRGHVFYDGFVDGASVLLLLERPRRQAWHGSARGLPQYGQIGVKYMRNGDEQPFFL